MNDDIEKARAAHAALVAAKAACDEAGLTITCGVLSREAKIAEGGGGVKVGWRWLVARDLVNDTGKEEPIQESGSSKYSALRPPY